jgi:hypothetical protein
MTYIKIAAIDSPSSWLSQANVICSGSGDQDIINRYLLSGNEVDLGPGPAHYSCNSEIRPQSNVFFHGQGAKCTSYATAVATITTRPTINFSGTPNLSGIHIYTVTNVQCGLFNLGGITDTGGVSIFPQSGSVDSIIIYDIYSPIKNGTVFGMYLTDYFGTTTNITYIRCWADSPDGFGFVNGGEGTVPILNNATYYRCGAKNAGVASTRVTVSGGTCWVCGIDTAEAPTLHASNVTVIACEVDGAWLDCFHMEGSPIKTNFIYLDNVAANSGQWNNISPTGYGYMAGFMNPLMPNQDSAIFFGNTSGGGNTWADVEVWDAPNNTYHKYTLPYDFVFPTGNKVVTRITQGNCTGIAVWDTTYWDVYLYSSDQNPVSETIVLPDNTPLLVSFTDFLIQRNIVPNPQDIFIHGTSHTGSFEITIAPANESCQVQLWLAVSATASFSSETAKSSLISFISGTNVPVSVPITMPAAGIYYVYIDLYMLGIKIESFTEANPITVI